MKIFQAITVSEYGGAQSVVANLCRELSQDNQVFVIYGGGGEAWEHLDSNIIRLRYGKHRKEISWKDFFVWLRLVYYRFKYRPDIVHLHSSKMGALGRLAFPKKKIVYTVHGFDSMRIAFRKLLIVERLLATRAARIVGVSDYDVRNMEAEKINGNFERIYNGIHDFTQNEPPVLQESVVKAFEDIRSHYRKVVVCIARLAKPKNFELFVQIAQQLPEYAFVWIGNEKEVSGLPKNVFCLGSLSQAYYYLSFADVFILTSDYEGLPMSIIEAFCFSKPVVASNVGGIVEMIEQSKNGFVLPNDATLFAKNLRLLLENEMELSQCAVNARRTYEDKFKVEMMVANYKRIYNDIH